MDYAIGLANFDFTIIRGVSETIRFWDWKKEDNLGNIYPINLTGKIIRAQFKADPCDFYPDFEKSTENGGLLVGNSVVDMVFGEETLDYRSDVYYYDILIIDDNERLTMVYGKVVLTGVITR